jgi:hypothetical protein
MHWPRLYYWHNLVLTSVSSIMNIQECYVMLNVNYTLHIIHVCSSSAKFDIALAMKCYSKCMLMYSIVFATLLLLYCITLYYQGCTIIPKYLSLGNYNINQ